MSTNVRDLSLGRFQHHRKVANLPAVEAGDIFGAMSDGVYTVQSMLKFAGFDWSESQFVVVLAGIIGNGHDALTLSDAEIAAAVDCNPRTVQRWRTAYKLKATQVGSQSEVRRFCPLKITEKDHDRDKRITPSADYQLVIADLVQRSVSAARAMPEYETDRLAALEKAATMFYEDMPEAGFVFRERSRGRSLMPNAPAHLEKAFKSLEKAEIAIEDMNDLARENLLAVRGDEMYRKLLELQEKTAELLRLVQPSVENKGDDHTYDKMSRISEVVSEHESSVHDKEEYACTPDKWEPFALSLTNQKANGKTIQFPSGGRSSPKMSFLDLRACEAEMHAMVNELDEWEYADFQAEAAEYSMYGRLPEHRSAKERAFILYLWRQKA